MAFFGRFTERAQRALIYARKRQEPGHNYVGTEHLLLGLYGKVRERQPKR